MSPVTDWARVLLTALAEAGVREVVLSPGSRSTPFVWAAVEEPRLRCLDVVDERAAAFVALGHARVTGAPTLLVCTSGTAAAHYLPAVIEASEARVPLIVLSADRPFELHGSGANQTIDQTRLFGAHARMFVDLPSPDDRLPSLRALRRVAVQAVSRALGPDAGPVHLNARVEKPLEPDPSAPPSPEARAVLAEPLPRVWPSRALPSAEAVAALASACASARRPLIVAGPAPAAAEASRRAVEELARRLGAPLLVEATSQLRLGPRSSQVVALDAFDAVLRSAHGRAALRPDLVLQLGRSPVSTGFERWVAEAVAPRWVIAPHGWEDPSGTARHFLRAAVEPTLAALLAALGEPAPDHAETRAWREAIGALDERAWHAADAILAEPREELSEAVTARELVAALPEEAWLAVGNSLAVRQLDGWVRGGGRAARVLSQRGVSGIDGLVAGAAGAAWASRQPTFLLLGDVSFSHDLGGLAAARGLEVPLVVVVVDNGGGRIFEQLPVAAALPALMPHFLTPPGADIEAAARVFGHRFARARTREELARALAEATRHAGCTVVQAKVPEAGALADNRRLWDAVDRALGARGR